MEPPNKGHFGSGALVSSGGRFKSICYFYIATSSSVQNSRKIAHFMIVRRKFVTQSLILVIYMHETLRTSSMADSGGGGKGGVQMHPVAS